MDDEEIRHFMQILLQQQAEMLTLMKAMNNKMTMPEQEVWLTKEKVMDYLCVSERSFYRRKDSGNWKKRKSGGIWYYLKESILQDKEG